MKNSHFKIQISEDGKTRWVDSDKLFTHLFERYTKTIPNGDKPKPYEEKVENFFANIDAEWLSSLRKAYPNVDIDTELDKAKMWLLSNTPKRNLKKFVNNWMAKAMGQRKNQQKEAVLYEKYVPPVINDDELASPEEIQEMLRRK